jgi:hypothetical protein
MRSAAVYPGRLFCVLLSCSWQVLGCDGVGRLAAVLPMLLTMGFRWVPRGQAHPCPSGRCWLPPARVILARPYLLAPQMPFTSAPDAGSNTNKEPAALSQVREAAFSLSRSCGFRSIGLHLSRRVGYKPRLASGKQTKAIQIPSLKVVVRH